MSELDLLRDEDLRTEREEVKEPAKRWRNWWRAPYDGVAECVFTGKLTARRAGEAYPGFRVYPSQDAAETSVKEIVTGRYGGLVANYLGAYPEGDRPHD